MKRSLHTCIGLWLRWLFVLLPAFVSFSAFVLLSAGTCFGQNDVVKDDEASGYNLNKPERVEWFRQAGAGLFVHFGVDAQLGVVISHTLVGASDDYTERYFNELPRTFDPYRFRPHDLAVLAKLAGMKYIMFTTKHHSGFCMWDTQTNDFNIMHTPYHKDLLKEFVEATREAGLQVGFYFSPEDFYFLHRHHLPISRTDVVMDAATRKEYDDYTRRQCEELMKNYGKIDLLFIDGDPKEVVKRTCWGLQPDLLITRGAMKTPEQTLPGATIKDPWLSCITMGTAWQYQPTNERYKSGNQLIQLAIEARARGGSLLLNVGPKPDGELPIEQEERLREMAAWYFVNHECMDSVGSWVVSREQDTWYTVKGGHTLYAIVTDTKNWREGQRRRFILHSVKSTPATVVNVLGQNSRIIEYRKEDVGCRFRQTAGGLEVSVVKAQRIYDDHRWPDPVVIKLEGVDPVFAESATVTTGSYSFSERGASLSGSVADYPRFHKEGVTMACFYYRPYAGQVETLYAPAWEKTPLTAIGPDGHFEWTEQALKPDSQYEYKAIVLQEGVEVEGPIRIGRMSPAPPPIIPRPRNYETGRGYFRIRSGTRILAGEALQGAGDGPATSLRELTGLALPFLRPGEDLSASPKPGGIIHWDLDSTDGLQPEGYRLIIDSQSIHITGYDPAGLFYGMQSLAQLLEPEGKQGFRVRACRIEDGPRFHYRGMHLDVSRHFFPVPAIKKWINTLALFKFNAFHWHLTDDQGWRIEIKRYPALQTVSAWRDQTLIGHKKEVPHRFDGRRYGGYYTQEEVREIVRYAEARHITVIPEIEMPGHAQAVLAAYPSLGCTGGPYKTAQFWGIFEDVFCAGNDSVFVFLQNVLDEVMDLFPSKYIHIGGDECPKTRWAVCPKCQRRIRELGLPDEHALQSYFVQRMEKYINSRGRSIIGWDEILEGGLAPNATVMSWRGEEGGLAAARQRHPVIMVPESHLYFDYYQSLYPEEPLAAGGYTPLRKTFGYEPLSGQSDPQILQYIYGVQGQLWTEYTAQPEQVEHMLFPRAAAVAELGWSPAASSRESASRERDYEDFLRRFRFQEGMLQKLHIHYADHFDEINFSSETMGADSIRVSLFSSLPGGAIRYTVDGSDPGPGSALYKDPVLLVKKSCLLKARLFDRGKPVQRIFRASFRLHKGVGASVSLAHQPVARYSPGAGALVNGLAGSDRYNDGQWLGFAGDDLEAVIDLGSIRPVRELGTQVLNYHWQRMWAPVSLVFSASTDGIHYTEVFRQTEFPVNGINHVIHRFPSLEARYIKVTGVNKGAIPAGEYGAGGKALLMADEVIID